MNTKGIILIALFVVSRCCFASIWTNSSDPGLEASIKILADKGAISGPVLSDEQAWYQVELTQPLKVEEVSRQVHQRYTFYRQQSIQDTRTFKVSLSSATEQWLNHSSRGDVQEEYRVQLQMEEYGERWALGVSLNSQKSGSLTTEGSWLAYSWGSGMVSYSQRNRTDPYSWGRGLIQAYSNQAEHKVSIRQSLLNQVELGASTETHTSNVGNMLLWKLTAAHRVGPVEYSLEHLSWQENKTGRRDALEEFVSGTMESYEELTLGKLRTALFDYKPFNLNSALYSQVILNASENSWLAGLELLFNSDLILWAEINRVDWSQHQLNMLQNGHYENGIIDDGYMIGFHWNYTKADWLSLRVRQGDRQEYAQLQWKRPLGESFDLGLGVQWLNNQQHGSRTDCWLHLEYLF